MLKDRIKKYYIDDFLNCAESLLHAASDEYNFNLKPDTYKAIGGFGAGIGCGNLCGALAASIATLGLTYIKEDFHKSPKSKEMCVEYLTRFKKEFGSEMCDNIKCKYATQDVRCLKAVEKAADILEELIKENKPE